MTNLAFIKHRSLNCESTTGGAVKDNLTASSTYHEERVVVCLARAELAARLPAFVQGTVQLALNGALRHLPGTARVLRVRKIV